MPQNNKTEHKKYQRLTSHTARDVFNAWDACDAYHRASALLLLEIGSAKL